MRQPVCRGLCKLSPIQPWESRDHTGPQELPEWPGLLKGLWSTYHPPSEDPLAGLANRECWPKRSFSESAPPLAR